MKIVRFKGGLGNQMFQYAFYEAIRRKYPTDIVSIDLSPYLIFHDHNGFELNNVFSIDLHAPQKNDVEKLVDENVKLNHKFRRLILGRKKTHYIEKEISFNPDVFNIYHDILYDGYWQSWKYFTHLNIKEIFQFSNFVNPQNQELAKQIKESNSISIHIRRGDYYSNPNVKKVLGNICNITYYQKAMAYIEKSVQNPMYFIFSDTPEWVESNFPLCKRIIISHNHRENSHRDMQLMSLCKHNIIANSSFSWWAAYLNNDVKKIVIAPKNWFNESTVKYKIEDIIPENWIKYV
jgi:hypothetical protein